MAYCKKCKWLKEEFTSLQNCYPPVSEKTYECIAPPNMILLKGGNWYEEPYERVPNKSPQKINENNDCGWYEPKQDIQ